MSRNTFLFFAFSLLLPGCRSAAKQPASPAGQAGKGTAGQLSPGRWMLEEDSLATVVIERDQWQFGYAGKAPDDADRYRISLVSMGGSSGAAGEEEHLVLTRNGDTLRYAVLTRNDSVLSLQYLPRGNRLLYRRR